MLRRSHTEPVRNSQGQYGTRDWQEDDLLSTRNALRKKCSPMKILLSVIAACGVIAVLYLLFRSGADDRLEPPKGADGPAKVPEGKKPADRKSIMHPIELMDRCECRICKQWRENRRKPWLKPRKDDHVKGCESHLMEYHQVSSKHDGHVLPGPGDRFQHPGVICDICQKDFKHIAKKLWDDKKELLHSWTCYVCVWEDPDRFIRFRDPKTGKMEKRHAVNHGVDVCGVCADKCPDQIRTFTDLGPEGKLLHPGHPGDHLTAEAETSLIGEMRKRVHDEL